MFNAILRNYKEAFSGLSRENWLLSFVMLINRMGTMAAVFMSVYVTQILKRNLSDAGVVITCFGAGGVLGSLLGGVLIKKFGFRSTQIGTSILSGLLYILFSTLTHFTAICFLAVLIGLVSESFRPANFTAVAYYSKPEVLTKSYSLNRFAINLGMGLGTGLGGIIASIDYHMLFITEGITNILVGLLILFLLPSTKERKVPEETQAKQTTVGKSPWKDLNYLKFMLLMLFYISSFLIVFRFAPVFWKMEKHMDESLIGSIIGINGFTIAIFEMVLVQKLQTRNRDIYYIFGGILFAAGAYAFLILPFMPALLAVLCILMITVSEMLALPFINTYVVNSSDTENRGSYASVYTLVWSLAGIIAPMTGAFIAEHLGYNKLWLIVTLACIVCALMLRFQYIKPKKLHGQP